MLHAVVASQSAKPSVVYCMMIYSMQTPQTMQLVPCVHDDLSVPPGSSGLTRQMWQMKLSSLSSPGSGDSSLTGRLADRRSADGPRCCAASRMAAVPTSNGLCTSSITTSGLDLHA